MFKRTLVAIAAIAAVAIPTTASATQPTTSGCTTQTFLDGSSQVIGLRAKCTYFTHTGTIQDGVAAKITCDWTGTQVFQSTIQYTSNTWSEYVYCPVASFESPPGSGPYRGHVTSTGYRIVNALSCHQPLDLAYCGGTPGGPTPAR